MIKAYDARLRLVIQQLQDGHYHQGRTLAYLLNISHSALGKVIQKLRSYGMTIVSCQNKGYGLLAPLILLDPHRIKQKLACSQIELVVFDCIDSTNHYLKSTAWHTAEIIQCCLSEQQTAGRGRFNQTWYSPFGNNLYLSCSFVFRKEVSELSGLSLVVSLAIVQTLREWGIHQFLFVKWPNDVLYDHQKLCGSLIEIQAESNGQSRAIIGIGINVNLLADPKQQITQPWTSMRHIMGEYIDRNHVASSLLNHLVLDINQFMEKGLFSFFERWQRFDYLWGKMISVMIHNQQWVGKAMGINDKGYLLLTLSEGRTCALSTGEARLIRFKQLSEDS